MATSWEYKSVYLKIHPQPRDAAPKPGKLVVACPAVIEPLIAGQEQRLLSDYLDHQNSKGWELFSVIPDGSSERGPCFLFRRASMAAQPTVDASPQQEEPAPAPATAALKPPPGVTQPTPPVAAPAMPVPAPQPPAPVPAAPPAAPSPVRAPARSSPGPIAAPPPAVAAPARTAAPSTPQAVALAPVVPPPMTAPAAPPRKPMPSHPGAATQGVAGSAPAHPPPLPAAAPPPAAPLVSPPAPLAARGSAPARASAPLAHPAPPAPAIPPPLPQTPPANPQQELFDIVMQAIDLGARGNPQGWAEMMFVTRTSGKAGIDADQMYALIEHLEANRVLEWMPASQTPRRGGWIRRFR